MPTLNSREPAAAGGFRTVAAIVAFAVASVSGQTGGPTLDRAASRWVEQTLAKMSLEEKIGQLIVPTFESSYVSTDSDTFDGLARLVRDYRVAGFHVFGATELAPPVLLNPTYGSVILGQPLAAAAVLNRLQALSTVPLLNTADFETGVGFRLAGATTFPRQMAIGAANDERLAREAARITAVEARAVGVHVNFSPLADVNNNARNPVINTRSFGEDPSRVGALVAAFITGTREGGAIATIKHFPGHGDTDLDTHRGRAILAHARDRLDRIELVPFRRGLEAGAEAVMAAHIELPSLDPAPETPATFSSIVLDRLLRQELGFRGLVYTDSMSMVAITDLVAPGEAAVRSIAAGADQLLHSPHPIAAFEAIKAAVTDGRISQARVNESVARVLRAKASLGLQTSRAIDLAAVDAVVGSRRHRAVADEIATRSITLLKDDRRHVPLPVASGTPVLYLSLLDYPSGWSIASPSRTFITELRKRWPQVTAIELSDRTPLSEIDVVRAIAPRYGAVVASAFVRATSGTGRIDLPPELVRLLRDLSRITGASGTPFVATLFGNPYVAMAVPEVPAVLLTYDVHDLPEAAAVRALAGEAAITGRLPISLPGLFPLGHGLDRAARTQR